MFDDTGRPTGMGQNSPFTDTPRPRGGPLESAVAQPAQPGAPNHPPDPGMTAWVAQPPNRVRALTVPQSAPSAQQFIQNYQQSGQHQATEGTQPLLQAMQAAGYNVAPYMYGSQQSGNEISLDGSKYKVLGAEGGPNAYWYQAGTNDSAPQGHQFSPLMSAVNGGQLNSNVSQQPPSALSTYLQMLQMMQQQGSR